LRPGCENDRWKNIKNREDTAEGQKVMYKGVKIVYGINEGGT